MFTRWGIWEAKMSQARKTGAVRFLWSLTLALSGLSWGGASVSAQDVTVGWTSYPADIPVIADAIEGGKAEAEKLGVRLEFALSAGAAAQANAVDNLLALGVDVIAIDPEDSKAIGPS